MNIAFFIIALVLAAIVVIWIAYCMFIRERHKSEFYQYNISDLRHHQLGQPSEKEKDIEKREVSAGIFIMPSRHKQKDDYVNRPDYPESPVHKMDTGTDNLIEYCVTFDEDTVDTYYRDGITDNDSKECSNAAYHSDV